MCGLSCLHIMYEIGYQTREIDEIKLLNFIFVHVHLDSLKWAAAIIIIFITIKKRRLVCTKARSLCSPCHLHSGSLKQDHRILASYPAGQLKWSHVISFYFDSITENVKNVKYIILREMISDTVKAFVKPELKTLNTFSISCSLLFLSLQYGLMRCIPEWIWVLGSRVLISSS